MTLLEYTLAIAVAVEHFWEHCVLGCDDELVYFLGLTVRCKEKAHEFVLSCVCTCGVMLTMFHVISLLFQEIRIGTTCFNLETT